MNLLFTPFFSSCRYFTALSKGECLPVKERLEMNIAGQTTDTGLTPGLLKVLHKQVFFSSSQMYIDPATCRFMPHIVSTMVISSSIPAVPAAKVQQERAEDQMEGCVFAPRAAGDAALLGQLRLSCWLDVFFCPGMQYSGRGETPFKILLLILRQVNA